MKKQFDMFGGESNPLEEAKEKFFNALTKGGSKCLCCGRKGRLNRYTLNSSMVASLLWMSRTVTLDGGWILMGQKAPAWILATKAFSTMKFWGFIEPSPKLTVKERNAIGMKTKTSGHWRITPKGFEFLRGYMQVPSAALVYNDVLYGWTDETVNFYQAIAKQFDFNELMRIDYNWSIEPKKIDNRKKK